MSKIKKVTVYCSSSNKIADIYKEETKKLGIALSKEKLDLVFGGGDIGLMGIIAETMKKNGREVTGVTTTHIQGSELKNPNVTELIIEKDIQGRKEKMEKFGDAIIALPGGFGTIDEISEIVVLKQLGEHNKPIILFDINGFWDGLIALYSEVIDKHFAKKEHLKLFIVARTVDEVIEALKKPSSKISMENWRL